MSCEANGYLEHNNMDESSPYCLYHKVAEIPVVSAAAHTALVTYESSKNYSAIVAAVCSLLENGVGLATAKAQPVITRLQWPIEIASRVACLGLDRLEQACPAIKMTPEEMISASKQYYHDSYVDKSVGAVIATKDYGKKQVLLTRELCSCAVERSKNMLLYPVRVGGQAVSYSMDLADSIVEKYIAENSTPNDHDYTCNKYDMPSTQRLRRMSNRALTGVQAKAGRRLHQSRQMLSQAFGDLTVALTLTESLRTAGGRFGQLAHEGYAGVKGNAANVAQQIETYAKKYNIQPDVMLLRWVKSSTATLAAASAYVLKYSCTYLPDVCMHSLEKTTHYLRDLAISVNQAEDLGELKGELVAETKERLAGMEQGLLQALDYAADYAPLKWLAISVDNLDMAGEENVLLDMDREDRGVEAPPGPPPPPGPLAPLGPPIPLRNHFRDRTPRNSG